MVIFRVTVKSELLKQDHV